MMLCYLEAYRLEFSLCTLMLQSSAAELDWLFRPKQFLDPPTDGFVVDGWTGQLNA